MNKQSLIMKQFLAGFAVWLIFVQIGLADSYYSSIGLGLPKYFVSQKAVAMGGAGIGVSESMTLNAMNPAANNIKAATLLSVQFEYEFVNNSSRMGNVNTANGNATGVQFMFPVKKTLSFISAIRPLTVSRYMLETEEQIDQFNYSRTIKGNGGLSSGSLGLQYIFKEKISLAGTINFNFGSVNEEWQLKFNSTDYTDSHDKYNSHLFGVSYDFGLLVKPSDKWALGMVYKTGCELTQRTDIVLGSGFNEKLAEGKITYPMALGAGVSWSPAKMLFALDFYTQSWSRYKVNNAVRDDFGNYTRLSGGVEFLSSNRPTDRYRKRIGYRLGAYYARLPFTYNAGHAVDEKFVTLGLMLPFMMNNGRVDMALETGLRGNQSDFPYQERVYRFSISILGGERWFIRR